VRKRPLMKGHASNEIAAVAAASTRGPERRLIGRHPQRRLTGFSYQPTKIVLRRPLESAWAASIAVVHEPASMHGPPVQVAT
jgi:hypothetical protein